MAWNVTLAKDLVTGQQLHGDHIGTLPLTDGSGRIAVTYNPYGEGYPPSNIALIAPNGEIINQPGFHVEAEHA